MKREDEEERESKPNLILDSDDCEGEREDCPSFFNLSEREIERGNLRLKVDGNQGRSESNRERNFRRQKDFSSQSSVYVTFMVTC